MSDDPRKRTDPFTGRPRKPTEPPASYEGSTTVTPTEREIGITDRRWRRVLAGQDTISGKRIA